jgi:hypothetical protein
MNIQNRKVSRQLFRTLAFALQNFSYIANSKIIKKGNKK